MKLFKSLFDYFNFNQKKNYFQEPIPILAKPKPVQKKREKKPFPYYRKTGEYDEVINYQCLACKEHFATDYNTCPKFCIECGIQFNGEFTKQNQRHNRWHTTFKHPRLSTFIKIYNRKDITKTSLDKYSFGISVNTPITEERLAFTKDKDNYYKWETIYYDCILPFATHKSSKIVLNEQRKRMDYYVKTNKIIQLWAGPEGKEKLIKEIIGDDQPYEVGFGEIRCSGVGYYTVGGSG